VFAAIFSIWLAGDRLSSIGWVGGALIVVGMIVAEAWPLMARKTTPDTV
jgi:drug/metabolite transporter (DMT)-like permease